MSVANVHECSMPRRGYLSVENLSPMISLLRRSNMYVTNDHESSLPRTDNKSVEYAFNEFFFAP